MLFDKLNPTKAPGPEGWPLFCLNKCDQELTIPCLHFKQVFWSPQYFQTTGKKPWYLQYLRREIPLELTTTILLVSPHQSAKLWNPSLMTTFKNISRSTMLYHGFTAGKSCSTQLLLVMNDSHML